MCTICNPILPDACPTARPTERQAAWTARHADRDALHMTADDMDFTNMEFAS